MVSGPLADGAVVAAGAPSNCGDEAYDDAGRMFVCLVHLICSLLFVDDPGVWT